MMTRWPFAGPYSIGPSSGRMAVGDDGWTAPRPPRPWPAAWPWADTGPAGRPPKTNSRKTVAARTGSTRARIGGLPPGRAAGLTDENARILTYVLAAGGDGYAGYDGSEERAGASQLSGFGLGVHGPAQRRAPR